MDEGVERIKGYIQDKNKDRDSASGRSSSSLIHNTKRRKQEEPAIVPRPVPEP